MTLTPTTTMTGSYGFWVRPSVASIYKLRASNSHHPSSPSGCCQNCRRHLQRVGCNTSSSPAGAPVVRQILSIRNAGGGIRGLAVRGYRNTSPQLLRIGLLSTSLRKECRNSCQTNYFGSHTSVHSGKIRSRHRNCSCVQKNGSRSRFSYKMLYFCIL